MHRSKSAEPASQSQAAWSIPTSPLTATASVPIDRDSFGPSVAWRPLRVLQQRGLKLLRLTEEGSPEGLQASRSYFDLKRAAQKQDVCFLAVDIGSTAAKAALWSVDRQGYGSWNPLAYESIADLKPVVGPDKGLENLAGQISKLLEQALRTDSISDLHLDGIALVWSAAAEVRPFVDTNLRCRGLSCFASAQRMQSPYGAGDWWAQGLQDGTDIGGVFLRALSAAGIRTPLFVGGADTSFVAKAAAAHVEAGLVISSGAGMARRLGPEQRWYHVQLDQLRLPMLPGSPDAVGGQTASLGGLISCSGMARRFSAWVAYGAARGFDSLRPLAAALAAGETEISGRDLALLERGDFDLFCAKHNRRWFNKKSLALLQALTRKLIERGGVYAGLLAYLSVAATTQPQRQLNSILVDSAAARYLPGYFAAMHRSLRQLLQRSGVGAQMQLLEPLSRHQRQRDYEISVPMQGAAQVLNDLLTAFSAGAKPVSIVGLGFKNRRERGEENG